MKPRTQWWDNILDWKWPLLLIGLIVFGLAIRLYDITDAPLEFHSVRQLRSAIIARAVYYQILPNADPNLRQLAQNSRNTLETFEPPTQETLAALGYLLTGGENLWIGRLLSITFWIIGGLALFDLARRLTSLGGAALALAYYLILPFAVSVSRSFQPDALMVMGIIVTIWALYRWVETQAWRWALLTGVFAGATIFIKGTAVYPLAPVLALVVLATLGRRVVRSPQVWAMGALAVTGPLIYYVFLTGQSASEHVGFWMGEFQSLWFSIRFYVLWIKMLGNLMGLALLLIGMAGIALFAKPVQRWMMLGWWIGYFLFGLTFPFQIQTHEYYSLMLVPAVALCLAPMGEMLFGHITRQPKAWRMVAVVALILAIGYPSWLTLTGLKGQDYRPEILGWQKMGRELPTEGPMVALTHDYGFRVMYYGWRLVSYWPAIIDINVYTERGADAAATADFENFFAQKTAGMDYFLVTLFADFDAQPQLKAKLYDNYPYTKGEGYILFDLRHPLTP